MIFRRSSLLIVGLAALAIAGALSVALTRVENRRAAYIHVRWAPSIDGPTRERAELAHGLGRGKERQSRTWEYYVTNLSRANLKGLVQDPTVEDTNFIDRQFFEIEAKASREFRSARDARAARNLSLAMRLVLFAGLATLGLALARLITDGSWRVDGILAAILLIACIPRIYLAATTPYIHDEDNTAIPLAKSITFEPGAVHLPLRGENHGALPAYVVKISSTLFGQTPFGYRALHVLLGLCTIVLVYGLTKLAFDDVAARWAAALMAFNEYFLTFSSRATANTPYLFLCAASIYCFARFLATERPALLYAAAAAAGLAFYCKEPAALLLPIAFAVLLSPKYRQWLRRPALYLACAVFVLLISPDVIWNVRTDPDTAHVDYSGQYVGQVTYTAHLQRIGGIGLSRYPAMFYVRGPIDELNHLVTGEPVDDLTRGSRSVNPAIGLFLVAAILWMTVVPSGSLPVRRFLLFVAWSIFLFFTFIRPGSPIYRLSPVNWIWVEVTLLPAVVFGGALLSRVQGKLRTTLWVFVLASLIFAVEAVTWSNPTT